MKKKIKKIPTHNAIFNYQTNNKHISAGIKYGYNETDKNLFKDLTGGHDNALFSELGINLAERKWIWLSGKGIEASQWIDDEDLMIDSKGNKVEEWYLRLWKAEDFKLKEIGEFNLNYNSNHDVLNPDKIWGETSSDLFIKNDFFKTLEDQIYKNGIEFIKNLYISLGVYVGKDYIKNINKNENAIYPFSITYYDIDYTVKK